MNFLETAFELLGSLAKRLWPGVLGAAILGYLGASAAGLFGFVVGAATGALVGTFAGDRFGLAPVRATTGSRQGDILLSAAGAFILVGIGYAALQFALILAALAAILVIAAAWISG